MAGSVCVACVPVVALCDVTCPVFSAGPAAQPIVAGQTGTLTLGVESAVRFVTNDGTIDINLMLDVAPVTSANFLGYVRSGRYNGMMFHRSVPYSIQSQIGVIQGGGFRAPTQTVTSYPTAQNPLTAAQRPQAIVTDPPIAIEHAVGNVRGTLSMARTSVPASATDQFFINTVDNNVDVPGQKFSLDVVPGVPGREGYAVFGAVTAASLPVVDAIKNRPVFDMSGFFSDYTYSEVPMRRVNGSQNGFPVTPSDYVTVSAATVSAAPAAGLAAGGGWVCRWRRNGVDLVDDGRISGSGTAALSIGAMTAGDFGVYECVVTGLTCTAGSAVSSSVTLSCAADIGIAGGIAGSDGVLDNNDFISFINLFFAGDARADIGQAGGLRGSDGVFNNNDFIAFIDRFFGGC